MSQKPSDWNRLNKIYGKKYNREKIMGSFKEYCKFMLKLSFNPPIYPFHEKIMDVVQDTIDGKIDPRVALFMPMRHYKTLICADMFLTFMFGRKPHQRGVYGASGEGLAEERKDAFEDWVSKPYYRWLFPGTRIREGLSKEELGSIRTKKGVKNKSLEISNALSPRGKVIFVGEGTQLTGKPMHYGCCDDLYKDRAEAESLKINARKRSWFINVWTARFEAGAIGFLCYTRWTHDDVAGKQMEFDQEATDPNSSKYEPDHIPYTILRFPGIKDKLDDNPYDEREEGEALMDEMRFQYAAQKQDPDSYMAMVQQIPPGKSDRYVYNNIVVPEYDELPENLTHLVISVDTTYHEKTKNVDTVGTTILGVSGMGIYLLPDFINKKLNFNEMEQQVFAFSQRYPKYEALLIEAKSNGFALENRLSLIAPKVILVEPAGKSKRERAQVVRGYFAANQVHFPSRKLYPRVQEIYDEMKTFTGISGTVEKDDLIDTINQTLKHYDDIGVFTKVMEIGTMSKSDLRGKNIRQQFTGTGLPKRGYGHGFRRSNRI